MPGSAQVFLESGKMKKKKSTPTPHDAVFRQLLSQPDVARDFMEIHLPPQLLALCDLSTLRLASGSFVEDDLRPYFSDVLYSMKTCSGDDGYVQVLIEHQSTPDKQMAFRLLRYAVAAMKRHLDAGHKRLPLVIPVLFYAGQRSPYPYSTQHEVPLMTIAEQLKQEGELKGKREGMLEGELKGKLDVARSLLKMQLPRDTILQATGLTEKELDRLGDH